MLAEEHLLLRQVNPAWVQHGRISSQTFSPTPKDNRLLSVYDGRLIDAQASYAHFTQRNLRSVGVVAVSTAEVTAASLTWRPDKEAFEEHAVIDFSELLSNGQIRGKATFLAEKARTRGWFYQTA